jgi:hypothetical protein
MDANNSYQEQAPVSPEQQKAARQKVQAEITKWLGKLEDARNYRNKIAATYDWAGIVREYHGDFDWAKYGLTDIYIPPLNLAFAYVQSEVPSLYLRSPHIKVNPKNAESIDSAKVMEKAINYVWTHIRAKRENGKNLQDALLVGHSWFKTGYSGEFGSVEDANGNTYEFVSKDNFFGYRLSWDSVLFNPDALDPPYDCRWIAHEVWAPLEEVKANPIFKNTNYITASNMPDKTNITGANSSNKYRPKEEMVCLYEVWDKKTMTVFTIAVGCMDYIREPMPWPYELRGFPFSYLCFNPSPVQPYGIPDVYTFRPQIMELMKIRAQQYDHIKRFNRQYIYKAGSISEESMGQLKQGITGAAVGVEDINDIKVLDYAPLQTDIYQVEQRVKEDAINISGQSPQERGATQQTSTRTFRELAQIRRGAENRRSRKIDVVEDFVEDIAGNLVALLQKFADIPFYVKTSGEDFQAIQQALSSRPSAKQAGAVTGPNGFTFTKEDIQGQFDLEVVAGSTTPLDREQTMNTLVSLIPDLQQLGVQPGGPVVGAIGNMIAENLDMPALTRAIEQEAQLNAQQRAAQAAQAQKTQDLQVGQMAAETQLNAEKVGIKQNELLLKAIEVMTPNKEVIQGEAE